MTPQPSLLIDHDWFVTYQRESIQMRGRFDSMEQFEGRRKHWLETKSEVTRIEVAKVTEVFA